MNLAKFVVLGALENIIEGSGYDIMMELENKKIDKWTEIKKGSVYHALKKLTEEKAVVEIEKTKKGLYPEKTIYKITDYGMSVFDTLQETAFKGLYPKFYGFKLALKFNKRKSTTEIRNFGKKAIEEINNTLDLMDMYLASGTKSGFIKKHDAFFMEHERMLFDAEKKWIQKAIKIFG